ncbi:helix-turn-helix transcriptional regulator [Ornithinimicrobium murale]|uniref:helix-turn-helix transcriptional regulator n=1 Tax=Ornithinimicrobium murale TaxID=1050153 RepID=UPI000E0E04A1|nr:LuxR family transcriptional regulator [Ornithinimicrobium murale]
MLEAVGVAPEEEGTYRALLHHPGSTVPELAARLEQDAEVIQARVGRLEELGLVSSGAEQPRRLTPIRPDVAVDVLVTRRRVELDRAQAAARELVAELHTPEQLRPDSVIEVLAGRSAIAARFAQLLNTAREELLVLDRPPYVADYGESDEAVHTKLAAGVTVHGIYSGESLEHGPGTDEAYRAARAGERSRLHADVPMKLVVADRQIALLPLSLQTPGDSALVVHSSALLDALQRMFWLLWEQAVPIVPELDEEEADADPRLLTMLSAGMKDESIARHLGVSSRTVGRRVAELMERLGVRTRFQAGVYAQRRELLADPAPELGRRE